MAENSFAVTAAGGPSESRRTLRLNLEHYTQGRAVPRPDDGQLEMVSCGVPIPGCQVKIVDGQRRPLEEGLVGEVAVQSPYLLKEYLNNPQATAQSLDQDGWFFTGDLGFLLDCRLYVTGRQKDLIIVGGRNFYPQDIESIVNTCPGAIPGRCVALGLEDEDLGTQKVLVLLESHLTELAEKSKLAAAVRRRVFEELDCPVAEVWVKEHMWLLKTSSGKIARKPNLERYLEESKARKAPTTDAPPHTANLPSEKAGLLETAAWSLAASLLIYFYFLFFVFGENQSWNIYAGF
jgi:acyl-CoA synthetase (AMP-forming)/AMP-acid ligase II